jgi:type IV pilus biogenesis protein CpaD/CtpE
MKKTLTFASYLPVLVACLGIGTAGFSSCKKKEEDAPPPPLPSAPAPAPTPEPVVVAPEEDATVLVEDAGPKKVGKAASADVLGLKACCAALQQNAASMPPPNNTYAVQAAAMCQQFVNALASGGMTKGGALGSLSSIMKGANLPPACK